MSVTEALHLATLRALGGVVVQSSTIAEKPLLLDMTLPNPPRIRVYAYSLVGGVGERIRQEYKIVLRVPGQKIGDYGSFDHSDGRFTVLLGYREDLDVFVLWDASLHTRFKSGGNLQVRDGTVHNAIGLGRAHQIRTLTGGQRERVLVCRSPLLVSAINERVSYTGHAGDA